MEPLIHIGILLALAGVWLLVNVKAGETWLKVISIIGLLIALGSATAVTMLTVFA